MRRWWLSEMTYAALNPRATALRAIDRFPIKIFMGRDELARVVFRVEPLEELGRVEYTGGNDTELDAIMGVILRRRLWDWSALSATLRQSLTMSTGGRYVLRFHETPAPDGRGGDDSLNKAIHRGLRV